MKETPSHWIRIQFDESFDHFLVDGSYKSTPKNMFIDGYQTHERALVYLKQLMYEVEEFRRNKRKQSNQGGTT